MGTRSSSCHAASNPAPHEDHMEQFRIAAAHSGYLIEVKTKTVCVFSGAGVVRNLKCSSSSGREACHGCANRAGDEHRGCYLLGVLELCVRYPGTHATWRVPQSTTVLSSVHVVHPREPTPLYQVQHCFNVTERILANSTSTNMLQK